MRTLAYKMDRTQTARQDDKRSVQFAMIALLLATVCITGCGTTVSAPPSSVVTPSLNGNWQFLMAPPSDGSFSGGLEGGFLTQSGMSGSGSINYAVTVPPNATPCNSGAATVTGTVNGENVSLTVTAGSQVFTLAGAISFDGTSMTGTYTSSAGTAADGSACGTSQAGLQWSATLVPPLTGSLQGTFHSAGGSAGLDEQDFLVSGSVSQATSTTGATANVTGALNFMNILGGDDYPCLAVATLSGQISGNTVVLQINENGQSTVGNVGAPLGEPSALGTVTFDSTENGYVLHSLYGTAYAIYSSQCGGGTLQNPADYGSVCLGLNSSNACTQPITLIPVALTFPAQAAGTTSTQTITLTNSSGASLNGLNLALTQSTPTVYSESDTCAADGGPTGGSPFNFTSGQSCFVSITFAPQCTASCPESSSATLIVNIPNTDMIFTLPIKGTAESASISSAQVAEAEIPLHSEQSGTSAKILTSTVKDVENYE